MPSDDAQTGHSGPTELTRRTFIKGVIAGGVAVSSAAYLLSTAIESCTGLAIENCTLGGGDEPLVRRFLLCSCSLSLRG